MNFCPICVTTSEFKEFRDRPTELCPNCKGLLRQRVVYLFLSIKGFIKNIGTNDFTKRVLHFAPERTLFNALSSSRKNTNYRCFDYSPERYKFAEGFITRHDLSDLDATSKLPVADIILHNHVLEHLPGDVGAIIEALNSVLAPGGVHVFTIPMRKGVFSEDLSPALTAEERIHRFGQEDHLRLFGADDVIPMMQSIMHSDDVVFRLNDHIGPDLAKAYGVSQAYDIDRANRVYSGSIFYYVKPAR